VLQSICNNVILYKSLTDYALYSIVNENGVGLYKRKTVNGADLYVFFVLLIVAG